MQPGLLIPAVNLVADVFVILWVSTMNKNPPLYSITEERLFVQPRALLLLRALRVRKKMSGEKMPVKMIGDILTAQLPHMQPYIRFCSCQLNGAALIQQKTDEVPEFKEFVKVRKSWGCPGWDSTGVLLLVL